MTKANLKVEQIEQEIVQQQNLIINLLERRLDQLKQEADKLRHDVTKNEQILYRMAENVTTFKVVGDYTHPVKTEYSGKLCITV